MNINHFLRLSPQQVAEMTLHDAAELFISSKSNPNTRTAYRNSLKFFLEAVGHVRGGPRRVKDVTPTHIQVYVNGLHSRETMTAPHAQKKNGGDRLSPATIRKDIRAIKTLFNFLVKLHVIEFSPAANVPLPAAPKRVSPEKIATNEEVEQLVRVAYGHTLYYAILMFMLHTGCRAGGAASLLDENVRLDAGEAVVNEKNGLRTVWFGEDCAKAMHRWQHQRPEVRHGHFFFVGRRPHQPYKSASISNIIENLARKAGIERPLHSHHLRHWRAVNIYEESGGRSDIAAAAIGDTVRVFEESYLHTPEEDVKSAVQRSGFRTSRRAQKTNIIRFDNMRDAK
jgi:site-specific recombinase XerD